ncbi:Shedu immune nuclease family protein [Hydrogenophaga sp. A37]|nr:hypothetical protein B0E41_08700 [Hydrogenophaga sp. A37]
MTVSSGEPKQAYSDSDVLDAAFRIEHTTNNGQQALDLFLKTFKLVDRDARIWHAHPESAWPLLATVTPTRIIMRPIHANPHQVQYLNQKNGKFGIVIYEDGHENAFPNEAKEAAPSIAVRLPYGLFDPLGEGLGLPKDLDTVWQTLSRVQGTEILVVSRKQATALTEGVICIREDELDKLRRKLNRVKKAGRKLVRQTRQSVVHDDVLTKLDPEKFRRAIQVNQPLLEVRRETVVEAKRRVQGDGWGTETVREIAQRLPNLAKQAPRDLMMLHAEIERATLATVIEKYDELLGKTTKERHWQSFFEQNKLVLSMVFARPVELLHTQFHAKPSTITGAGAQIGDFLFGELGQALAIVEIKRPGTELVHVKAYRGKEVFGPSAELSGAMTQVLYQQSELRQRWTQHTSDTEGLRSWKPDVIKCVVIAGSTPTEPVKRRSFEVFRNSCKDVEVVTFDELLNKLKLLHKYLTPPENPADDVPF